jgi:ATP-dependent Lhr-like helicase
VLLPARVPGYRSEDLDMLAATGQIVWVGRGAAGPKDGKVAIYRREHVVAASDDQAAIRPRTGRRRERRRSAPPVPDAPAALGGGRYRAGSRQTPSKPAAPCSDQLSRRGACFLMELQRAAERAGHRVSISAPQPARRRSTPRSGTWSGRAVITNDTFAPLRSLGQR